MPDKQKGSAAPHTSSSPEGKVQPWKSFWPLQGENGPRAVIEVNSASSENAAKYWYALERGGLIAEQEKKLAVVMQTAFHNKSWYSDRKEDWDGLNPMDMVRRLSRCPNCGQPTGNCACGSTFEGG